MSFMFIVLQINFNLWWFLFLVVLVVNQFMTTFKYTHLFVSTTSSSCKRRDAQKEKKHYQDCRYLISGYPLLLC